MPTKPTEITTSDQLMEIASSYKICRILLTGIDLGIFTALGKQSLPSATIAEKVGGDPRAVDRLLNAMVASGLMRKEDDLFSNTRAGLAHLDENSEEYLGGLGHQSNLFVNWATLTDAVRKGGAVINTEFESEKRRRDFIRAMHYRARKSADKTAAMLDLDKVSRTLDVGGGSGVFSLAMCRARPGLRATVLDLPQVTAMTREFAEEAGLADRMETIEGNFHEADFGSGYDLVLFSAIVHINSFAQNRALMVKAAKALNPGGRIVVMDFMMEENRTEPAWGAVFSLNMLVNTDYGDTYTEKEIRSWLTDAGCESVTVTRDGPVTAMIVGEMPG